MHNLQAKKRSRTQRIGLAPSFCPRCPSSWARMPKILSRLLSRSIAIICPPEHPPSHRDWFSDSQCLATDRDRSQLPWLSRSLSRSAGLATACDCLRPGLRSLNPSRSCRLRFRTFVPHCNPAAGSGHREATRCIPTPVRFFRQRTKTPITLRCFGACLHVDSTSPSTRYRFCRIEG